jgi:hypothetical protein
VRANSADLRASWSRGWIWMLWPGTAGGATDPAAKLAYQGRLSESGRPANGTFEMRFRLFDTPEAGTGTPQGEAVEVPGVAAQEGVFTAVLDFGVAVFDGSPPVPRNRSPQGGHLRSVQHPRPASGHHPGALCRPDLERHPGQRPVLRRGRQRVDRLASSSGGRAAERERHHPVRARRKRWFRAGGESQRGDRG